MKTGSEVLIQSRSRVAWTATEIMAMDFPDPRWAVPGVLPEGVTLLVGAPKIGKSWLSLNISTAVAAGGMALGQIPVVGGDVLYLALEDTPRRLKSRLTKVLDGGPANDRLTFVLQCEPLAGGGADRITAWVEAHPEARLLVVDVFARVRGSSPPNLSLYDADYLVMGQLKHIADRHGIAILVVHHTRKMAADDFTDSVSGTNGLAGAADAVLVLRRSRGKADAELHVTGRDVEEAQYALNFRAHSGAWQLLEGQFTDYALSDTRRAILEHLRGGERGTPRQLSEALDLNHETVKKTCKRMFDDAQIDTDGQGMYYALAALSPVSLLSPSTDQGQQGHRGQVTWEEAGE